jgi:hypothetical protein
MSHISDLDWGTITPEFYNREKNSAVHVFNHCLIGEENVSRAIKFAIGRIEWYKSYLPQGCTHEVVFDDRGQDISDSIRDKISADLSKLALYVSFMSKGR